MRFVNLTPHVVRLNDGREFLSQGVARVQSSYTIADENRISRVVFGPITGLPEGPHVACTQCGCVMPRNTSISGESAENWCIYCNGNQGGGLEPVTFITSAIVAKAAKRDDVVAPATNHPDTVRDRNGQVVAVPCFCRE